jgi:two-component system chemotaxis response regulator CheB
MTRSSQHKAAALPDDEPVELAVPVEPAVLTEPTVLTEPGEQTEPPELTERPELVVVVGGSAGCLTPLRELVAGLPAELPVAVLVVVHRGERTPSHLAEILGRSGPLPASLARDGEPIQRGHIYVAPPSRHLTTGYGWIRLRGGPRVNRHRPAIDLLFASTARWTGRRTVAVVLSGVLDDGAVGAALVALVGGRVLVQAPAEAHFASMPAAAQAAAPNAVAHPASQLAEGVLEYLTELSGSADLPAMHTHGWKAEMNMAESNDPGYLAEGETKLTRLACPECGGGLAQVELPQITYFRCHVGHQYAPKTLAAAQADATEAKLWSAVAALEEQAALLNYLDNTAFAGHYAGQDADPEQQARQDADAGHHAGQDADAGQGAGQDADAEQQARQIAERATILREQVKRWTEPPVGRR